MRHSNLLAALGILIVVGCAPSKPLRDMVGYVPPTSLPAQPKRTLVADRKEQVWTQLVDFLDRSAFEIDHIDEKKSLVIARYSGDPEPYVDCGSIVTHEGGTLGQMAGAAPQLSLNYELEKKPVVLDRRLNLDSRIIIRLAEQPRGTVIQTDATYVVTKTIDVVDASGAIKEGSREAVSFEAGNRGEFSKGTACQPNGSLDLAVLQSLPNIVGSDEIDRADLSSDGREPIDSVVREDNIVAQRPKSEPTQATPETDDFSDDQADVTGGNLDELDAAAVPSPAPEGETFEWVMPEQGLPTAALPTPDGTTPENVPTTGQEETAAVVTEGNRGDGTANESARTETAILSPETSEPAGPDSNERASDTIVDDTTRELLASLDCSGEEWHFCNLVELTMPYRKRNIEKLFGLTINTTESFTSQVVGRDLKLDILFPSFSSNLHIAYARRDGTVDHVMSTPEVWPADLAHQFDQSEQTIPGPAGLAMIIAIATDKPLFSSPPADVEDAEAYLGRLEQRLAELESENPGGSIAASQLLIYVEKTGT